MIKCASCQQLNEPHFKFCLGCGNELVATDSAMPPPTTQGWLEEPTTRGVPGAERAARPSPAAVPSPAPPTARTCTTCGAAVPESFTFCGQCGARVDGAQETVRNLGTDAVTQGRLVLIRADGSEGGAHPLGFGDNVLGRGTGPLFDADGYLSPRHAIVTLHGDGVTIADAGSLNGVFMRTTEEEPIEHGDVFRVGQEILRFELLPPAEPLPDGTHIMGSPPGGAWGRLVLIVSQTQDGSAFPISGEAVVLGRERGDIVFTEDGYVSGTHARVSQRNGRFYLSDLNSSNGTFLRLRGPRRAANGTLLLLGQQLFRVAFG